MRYQTIIYSEVPPARLRVADQLDNALNDSLTNGWRPISIDWGVGRSSVAVTYERLPAWEYTALQVEDSLEAMEEAVVSLRTMGTEGWEAIGPREPALASM